MKSKQISEQFYNLSQSWCYERIIAIDGAKLKVEIRRNAYDDQSYMRGYVLDSSVVKWNLVVNRPIKGSNCEPASYVQDRNKVDKSLFVADADSIIEELKVICS
jgi:hypothetical protein